MPITFASKYFLRYAAQYTFFCVNAQNIAATKSKINGMPLTINVCQASGRKIENAETIQANQAK